MIDYIQMMNREKVNEAKHIKQHKHQQNFRFHIAEEIIPLWKKQKKDKHISILGDLTPGNYNLPACGVCDMWVVLQVYKLCSFLSHNKEGVPWFMEGTESSVSFLLSVF